MISNMKHKKTILFDFTNVPHVNFLMPIVKRNEKTCDMYY